MHIDMGMKVYESVYRSIMEKISDEKHYIIVETNSRRGDSIMQKKGLPKPTGEYAVGTFTYTVKDDRKEIMRQGGMRSVAARVYYPVLRESVKGLTKAVALSDNMLKGFKDTFKADVR